MVRSLGDSGMAPLSVLSVDLEFFIFFQKKNYRRIRRRRVMEMDKMGWCQPRP